MSEDVIVEVEGRAALITLNRPKALNALTLDMIRQLTAVLLACRDAEAIEFVAIRGMGKEGPFGNFCAGGDIRFFHEAILAGDPRMEDFFTEEYTLNYLVNTFPKPYAVFMDGIVMGGGMGISGHARSSATMRVATERTKMAMPETNIGLFPDVGGVYFLARTLTLADDLRMERGLIRNAFHLRPGASSETMEGIRALAIDKDQSPRWNPARIEDVTPEMVQAYFESPWPAHVHPLRDLV